MMGFVWPDSRLCAVCLTFDVDGETVAEFADPENARRRISLRSEYAYGPEVALPHILNLLDVYELPATFFVPGMIAELHPMWIRSVTERGHEVAHHGYSQERPYLLTDRQEEAVLLRGIQAIEDATGRKPNGYRSSAWELKPSSPGLLLRHGFVYDSSLMGGDHPYLLETPAGRLLELPVNWRNDDWVQFGFVSVPAAGHGISAPSKAQELWTEEFEGIYDRRGILVMTMHPFLAGRPSGLRLLERLIRHLRGFPRVWWASLGEVTAYCLQSDVNSSLLVRPTEIPRPAWTIPEGDSD
jgi:peptidoglycan-N-acetylglucosamine deacetylase